MNYPPPFLTDDEIAEICHPLVAPAAQCRYMRDELGMFVQRRPSGRPLVARSEFERVMGAARHEAETKELSNAGPNLGAMATLAQKKGKQDGAKTQGR